MTMDSGSSTLAGLRILIVEDEAILAMTLEEVLDDFGCGPVAVAPTIEEALVLIRTQDFEGVLLDMNLRGRNTVSVAEELAARAVPFLLVTGYGPAESDPPLIRTAARLRKPYNHDQLRQRMEKVFLPDSKPA